MGVSVFSLMTYHMCLFTGKKVDRNKGEKLSNLPFYCNKKIVKQISRVTKGSSMGLHTVP